MNGIYIHIPFCKQICSYCDFPKQIAKEEVQNKYIDQLVKEFKEYEKQDWFYNWNKKTNSIYIGGGTPNSLSINNLKKLLNTLKPYLLKNNENTIEINPELLNIEQINLFKEFNINRISIGVQTFNNNIIKLIRRNHTYDNVIAAINLLKENGINNINIDMMYGLPQQSFKDLKKDVKIALKLGVKHISYYSLILEEKTILEYQLRKNEIILPDDDLVVEMANYLTKKLKKRGFIHYEISNYAKKGYESIHNLGYWNCEEYIGIGASACGYIHNYRISNHHNLNKYYDNYILEKNKISLNEQKQEYMMLGLRKLKGININEYFNKFNSYPNNDFNIDYLKKLKLIEEKNNYIFIKKDKIWLGNLVFEQFVGGEKLE